MPVSQTLEQFGIPLYSDKRKDWLTTLSWHQYTQQEIEEGLFESMFGEMYALR
jgi:gluconate kinase